MNLRPALLSIFIPLCIMAGCRPSCAAATITDSLMQQLEVIISHRDSLLDAKKSRIHAIDGELTHARDVETRFNLLNNLFDEYAPFNTDSAYTVSEREIALGRASGNKEREIAGVFHKAQILVTTGMYPEGLALIDSVNRAMVPDWLLPQYYHVKRTVYGYMGDYATFPSHRAHYKKLCDAYRDSIINTHASDQLAHVISLADKLNEAGKPQQALDALRNFTPSSVHEQAICYWTMAVSYKALGDIPHYREMLLRSSIADQLTTVREYVSLRELALLLYSEGDLDRAYRFMSIALDDAKACNARLRIFELSDSYPDVNGIYLDTVKKQRATLMWTLTATALLLIAVAGMLMLSRSQHRRLKDAHATINRANHRLEELNGRLTQSNDNLTETNARLSQANEDLSVANHAIAENSQLKEVYIGRYMDQCLNQIERLDSFRKTVNKLAAGDKTADLLKLTKSTALVDAELKDFYANFDTTFLSLFPTFVEKFNALLRPGEEVLPKRAGSLTPELRIYALVRLGITDSEQIARFLRYSLTTIYNYRTKMRNRAQGDRALFEAAVAAINR